MPKQKAQRKPPKKDDGLVSTAAAAEALGISQSQFRTIVRARGISPDDTYDNPHYKSAPPAALWSRQTLGRLRRTQAVKEAAGDKGAARRAAAAAATKTIEARVLAAIEAIQIEVKVLPMRELEERAIRHYNEHAFQRDKLTASSTADPDFLRRIVNNYVRHCLTSYDKHLAALEGLVGRELAYHALRDKTDLAVLDAYPHLLSERRATTWPRNRLSDGACLASESSWRKPSRGVDSA
jgi:hypothetical protein